MIVVVVVAAALFVVGGGGLGGSIGGRRALAFGFGFGIGRRVAPGAKYDASRDDLGRHPVSGPPIHWSSAVAHSSQTGRSTPSSAAICRFE